MNPALKAQSLITTYGLGQTPIHKPEGSQIKQLCFVESAASPRAEEMSIRQLTITVESITPVHMHQHKEKTYVFDPRANGTVAKVFMHRDGKWKVYDLQVDSPVTIPRGTPHALYSAGFIMITVITSNQDSKTIWENEE